MIGKAMIRFLRVGSGRKHDDMIKEAILTANVMLPPLSLYGKDHKPDTYVGKGPSPSPSPVVSANKGHLLAGPYPPGAQGCPGLGCQGRDQHPGHP